jgi:hypothetical protein
MCPAYEYENSKPRQECVPVTLAAELERPWVTFWTKAWTFPSNSNPDTPSVTSLTKPRGLPRKSTDPKMLAACHFSSYETNFVIINDSTPKSILWTYFSYNHPALATLPKHKEVEKLTGMVLPRQSMCQTAKSEISGQLCGPLTMVKWCDKWNFVIISANQITEIKTGWDMPCWESDPHLFVFQSLV